MKKPILPWLQTAFMERHDEEAIPLYNRLIDMNPYSAPYWFGLARCHFEGDELQPSY